MKKVRIILILFVVGILVGAVSSVSAKPPETFEIWKNNCELSDPVYCKLFDGDGPFSVLNGGKMYYYGPFIFNHKGKISSRVVMVSADEQSTLRGHATWLGTRGYFSFSSGTGAMEGIHAQGVVVFESSETGGTFSLQGTYH